MDLTRDQLAGLTGFSVASIRDYEDGVKDIPAAVRKRYRMACAAVAMGLEFDWENAVLKIDRPATLITGPRVTR